jgi:hypothetical protein
MNQLAIAASQWLRLSNNSSIRGQARGLPELRSIFMARLLANDFTRKRTLLVPKSTLRTNTLHPTAPFSITPARYVGNF